MKDIYVVTGNPGKLRELQMIFPKTFNLRIKKLDITEIQSLDCEEIVRDKLERAYVIVKKPVIVEDVSAELACLKGLPGPFMKFFENKFGRDALWELARHYDDRSAKVRCTMGYYDGKDMKIVEGVVTGQIVSPRGKHGWGFDFVFMPDGHKLTNAQMRPEEKNQISHRGQAIRKLVKLLAS